MSFHELRAACDEGRRRVTFEVEHSEEHGRVFLFGGDLSEKRKMGGGRWEVEREVGVCVLLVYAIHVVGTR